MCQAKDLLHLLSEYEATLRQSAELPEGGDNVHRKTAVALRRRMADQIASLAAVGETVFANDVRKADFRNRISRVRTAMALHQASYPIVAIDRQDAAYRTSVSAVRAANDGFIRWVRIEIG